MVNIFIEQHTASIKNTVVLINITPNGLRNPNWAKIYVSVYPNKWWGWGNVLQENFL